MTWIGQPQSLEPTCTCILKYIEPMKYIVYTSTSHQGKNYNEIMQNMKNVTKTSGVPRGCGGDESPRAALQRGRHMGG